MASGGYLNMVNTTDYEWTRVFVQSQGMHSWKNAFPQSVKPGEQHRSYIEFADNPKEHWRDYCAEVIYALEKTSQAFQIQASDSPFCHLCVDWMNTPENGLYVFPPPFRGKALLGWQPTSTVTLAVASNSTTLVQPVPAQENWAKKWMELYSPVIKNLCLHELTLAGTQNAGTCHMAFPLTRNWTRCQSLPVYEQLCTGVRALDFCIRYYPDKKDKERFFVVNEKWKTRLSLNDALEQIQQFVDENPQEILVADCHGFMHPSHTPVNFSELATIFQARLGPRLIEAKNIHKPLKSLWKDPKARVVAAIDASSSADIFAPGITRKSPPPKATTPAQLRDWIFSVFADPAPKSLWSLCAAITPWTGPACLSPHIDNWFYGGTSWARNANIIYVDWIEKTTLVRAAVTACLLKGAAAERTSSIEHFLTDSSDVTAPYPENRGTKKILVKQM